MRNFKREIVIAVIFIILSILLYLLNYAIFHDADRLFMYAMGELAFLPLEVLIVTVILHRLLEWRDKQAVLSKKSMLIGSFFSEIGISLLRTIVILDTKQEIIKSNFNLTTKFTKKEINQVLKFFDTYKSELNVGNNDIKLLKELILPKKLFLTNLIQHPILLEHKTFTDLLLATYHFAEELSYRNVIDALPEKDLSHLIGDIDRVYKQLLPEWIGYMFDLKDHYPYLFSLYARLNPFEKNINVTVS